MAAASMLGCAAPTTQQARWAGEHGGVEILPRRRVEQVATRLTSLLPPSRRSVSTHVLCSETLCAFTWPSGDVYISRGLIGRLNDDELTAVFAHELGHLLNDGKLPTVASLSGCAASGDVEEAADRTGCRLLAMRGISPSTMRSMLEKVAADPHLSFEDRCALRRRIDFLTHS